MGGGFRQKRWGCGLCALLSAATWAGGQTTELPFYEGFEPVGGNPADCQQDNRGHWPWNVEWVACDTPFNPNCPVESYPNPASKGWGPIKFESWPDHCAGGKVYAGYRAGRQPIADPYWYSMFHDFTPAVGVGDLHAEVWQYDGVRVVCACECNCDPDGPRFGYPNGRPNYQVQGWLILTNPARGDYFALGVNSYSTWTRLSWATKTDGWHATDAPREGGWRKLEIIVHPYTGQAGDVEFRVNGAIVGSGKRVPNEPISRVRLGGDPAMITQNHLTNTFEELWYDELRVFFAPKLCHDPRVDIDGDGDVDQADFGAFQGCFTGSSAAWTDVACSCFDMNEDGRIDAGDLEVFAACASGPAVVADETCDDPPAEAEAAGT
ncbi:MAG: hypothetical protein AMXMBFR83_10070 [Phycisphaerae bacterium]